MDSDQESTDLAALFTFDGIVYDQDRLDVFFAVGTAIYNGGLVSCVFQGAYPSLGVAEKAFSDQFLVDVPPNHGYFDHAIVAAPIDRNIAAAAGYEKTNTVTVDPSDIGGSEWENDPPLQPPPSPIVSSA